jgi:hypothetical protein
MKLSRSIEAQIEALHGLRKLVEKTADNLRPSESLDEEAVAQRRWQIMLGILTLDAARSMERLAKAAEVRTCIILARCIYEYRIRSAYYLKHPDDALRQYRLVPSRHYKDMQKLPSSNADAEAALAANYLEWRKNAENPDDKARVPAVARMAYDLAPPGERLKDANGTEYAQEEGAAYGIPSWYVHGQAPIILELFDDWEDPTNWRFYKDVRVMRLETILRGTNGFLAVYLKTLREAFNMDIAPVKRAFGKAWNAPVD